MKEGIYNGLGTMKYRDGRSYKGQWKDGLYHGQGKLTSSQDCQEFEGIFFEGFLHGKGVHRDFKKNIYTGDFKNGKKHGQAVINYADGRIFKGQYKDGLKYGNCDLTKNYKY